MSIRIKVNINQFGAFRVKTPEQSETREEATSMKGHDIVYESPNNTSSTEFELVYHADGHIYKVPSTTG